MEHNMNFKLAITVGILVTLLLGVQVYTSLGTRWGYNIHPNPYVVTASLVPLLYVVGTKRYDLVLPAMILALGVIGFTLGIYWEGALCRQQGNSSWGLVYDWTENALRFGPDGTIDGYACVARPNVPLVGFGYFSINAGSFLFLKQLSE